MFDCESTTCTFSATIQYQLEQLVNDRTTNTAVFDRVCFQEITDDQPSAVKMALNQSYSVSIVLQCNYSVIVIEQHQLIALIKITINIMLTIIAVVLIALWLLGMVTSYTIGGFIHILLIVAIIMILVRVIRGQKVF
jgi:hypothetical protein